MNRRQRLADLSVKIFGRAVELFDSDKMSFAEARKLAAQELATTERLKPRAAAKSKVEVKPLISDGDHPNATEELFARIFGIKERQDSPKTIGGRIKRILFTGDQATTPISKEPVASPAEATPETTPSTAGMQVYTGGSFGPNLIPDDEYPIGMCDRVTDNWRKSLAASIERSVSKPRPPDDNEVNPFNDAEVNAALARQQFRVVK